VRAAAAGGGGSGIADEDGFVISRAPGSGGLCEGEGDEGDVTAHRMCQHHHRLAARFTQQELRAGGVAGAGTGAGHGYGYGDEGGFGGFGGLGGDDGDDGNDGAFGSGGSGVGGAANALETRLRRGVLQAAPEELLPFPALHK